LAILAVGCTSGLGQTTSQQPGPAQTSQQAPVSDPAVPGPASGQASDQHPTGSITGIVVDASGAVVAGARVKLAREDPSPGKQSPEQELLSDSDGRFSFTNLAPGPFKLTITSAGFATKTLSGVLSSGQTYILQPITLAVAATVTDVDVSLSAPQVAEAQVKDEEKQRVLGVIPNFYVTYDPHPVSLGARQKFELAWKSTVDPFNFAITGAIAGIQQADDRFRGYGQGAQGYGKRYGASFADGAIGTFIGSAILPTLLKQDPRYFYKGTGSKRSRILYALANSVICKGDNGRWQANYSGILGSLAAGGISNLYYPASDRNGASLTFENALIGIGATGASNIFQEFFVRRFTKNLPNPDPAKPSH
jgi:Carboxypeptidase regulatory-like domain